MLSTCGRTLGTLCLPFVFLVVAPKEARGQG
jgi:hypothetical protein